MNVMLAAPAVFALSSGLSLCTPWRFPVWQIEGRVEDDLDLETCIGRVAAGDQTAFALMYDQLAPSVYGVARRVLRDPAQAEEVTQEVFTEIWRQATRFDARRGSVRTWAVTIAHRRAVDRVRSPRTVRSTRRTVSGRGPRWPSCPSPSARRSSSPSTTG
jgi:DNA-directed RNA polymerase specialized sigma24 family protein